MRGGVAVAAAGILFCPWLLATRSSTQVWLLAIILAVGQLVRWLAGRFAARRLPARQAERSRFSIGRERRARKAAKRRRASDKPVHTSITAPALARPATVWPKAPKASPVWMKRSQPRTFWPRGWLA